MQAYYETYAVMPTNHWLNIKLPETIPAGKIKIAVIYETHKTNPTDDFLAECRHQSLVIKNDTHEKNAQQWLETVADTEPRSHLKKHE